MTYLNFCHRGYEYFADTYPEGSSSCPFLCPERGVFREVDYEEAIGEVSLLLNQADKPLVYGLSRAGCKAQELALQLADRLACNIRSDISPYWEGFFDLAGQKGLLWPTLDDIRDNADVVILWGDDLYQSHPRLLARYAVFPRGKYIERGHKDRTVILLADHESDLKKIANQFVTLEKGCFDSAFRSMAKLVAEEEVTEEQQDIIRLRIIAKTIRNAKYAVMFFPIKNLEESNGAILQSLYALSRNLNRQTRFSLFPLDLGSNYMGAIQTMLRHKGHPFDGSIKTPSGDEQGLTGMDPLDEDHDVILLVSPDYDNGSLTSLLEKNQKSDILLVDRYCPSSLKDRVRVMIPSALPGAGSDEVAYRMDGLPVVLPALLSTDAPSQAEVIQDIRRRII